MDCMPFSVDVPLHRWPIANWGLMCVIAIASCLSWSLWHDPVDAKRAQLLEQIFKEVDKQQGKDVNELLKLTEQLHTLEKSVGPPGTLRPRDFSPLQLVTNIFVHYDLAHLLGNLFALFIFGNAINAKLGHLWFLLAYLGVGVADSLLWLAIGGGRPTLGASGAIMGIIGLFLVYYPRNDIEIKWMFELIPIHAEWIPAYVLILFYLAFDLIGAMWFRQGGIAHLSHLVGAALGFTLGILSLIRGWIEPEVSEENILQSLGFQHKSKRWEY